MTRLIGLAVLLLPLLEIAGFILVSRWIGLAGVLLAVVAGAVGGLLMLQRTGLNTVTRLRQALNEGREPGHSLIDGACYAAAALLLIVPGFVSDLMALALVLPWTRYYLLRRIAGRFETRIYRGSQGPRSSDGVIEAEFAEVMPGEADSEAPGPMKAKSDPPMIDLTPDSPESTSSKQ